MFYLLFYLPQLRCLEWQFVTDVVWSITSSRCFVRLKLFEYNRCCGVNVLSQTVVEPSIVNPFVDDFLDQLFKLFRMDNILLVS
jgi:hypothetical protein